MIQLYSRRVQLPHGVGPAMIRVDGPRIAAVQEGELEVAAGPVVNLGDKLVVPSFINAHTHLPMSSLRALGGLAARRGNVVEELWFRVEAKQSASDIRAFTRVGALECLLAGTGAVFEHYYAGREVADALAEVGLAGVVAPTLQDIAGPGVPRCDEQLDATLAIRGDARLAEAGVVAAWGPHATDTVSDELWARILREDAGLPVHVHVAQSVEEVRRAAERGFSPVGRLQQAGALALPMLLVHALFVSDADRRLLSPERHMLGHCPWSQAQFAFPAPLRPWLEDGFSVAVGTDAGASNDTMNVQQELRLIACGPLFGVGQGHTVSSLSEVEALGAARRAAFERAERLGDASWLLGTVTRAPGGFHPQLPLGRIAAGAWANLAVYDLDHPALWPSTDPLRALVFGDATPALHSSMVSGRWVGEVGDVRALLRRAEVREMIVEARERLARLLA